MDGVVLDLLKAASKGDAKVTPADLNKVISEVRRTVGLSCQGRGGRLHAGKQGQLALAMHHIPLIHTHRLALQAGLGWDVSPRCHTLALLVRADREGLLFSAEL